MGTDRRIVFRENYDLLGYAGLAFAFFLLTAWFIVTSGAAIGGYVLSFGALATAVGLVAWHWTHPELVLRVRKGVVETPDRSLSLDDVRGVVLQFDFEGEEFDEGLAFMNLMSGKLVSLAKQSRSIDRDVDEIVALTFVSGREEGGFAELARDIDRGAPENPAMRVSSRLSEPDLVRDVVVASKSQGGLLEEVARRGSEACGAPVIDLTRREPAVRFP